MRIIHFLILAIILTTITHAEPAYVLSLGYVDNTLVFSGIAIKNTAVPQPSLITGYHSIEQRNFVGLITYKNTFQPANGQFTVATPYQSDTRDIIIRDATENSVLSIPVLQFADTCGNNICESQESFEICSRDCSSGSSDDYCDDVIDGICDADCRGTDSDCRGEVQNTPQQTTVRQTIKEQPSQQIASVELSSGSTLYFILSGALLFILLTVVAVSSHKKGTRITQLKEYVNQNRALGYTEEQMQPVLLQSGYSLGEINAAFDVRRI